MNRTLVHRCETVESVIEYPAESGLPDLAVGLAAPYGRKHRRQGERDEQRDEHRPGDRDAALVEEAADDSTHERNRHEDGDDRERGRHDGEKNLLGSFERRRDEALAHLAVAHDVLDDDDGVVDENADRERQRHQRQHVQGEAENREQNECADDRHRKRERRDRRRASVAEE